ncbi:MAG: TlyA family RNA methyltransferase [Patescibacteria group bacterium]
MRLDEYLVSIGKVDTRSKAQDLIKRAKVRVGTRIITKPSARINGKPRVQLLEKDIYVSRAGSKLASVNQNFKIDFKGKVVLDVGSSTGGFTDYALRSGAARVVAVDVGTNQLHPSLRGSDKVALFEKTDIRDFSWPSDLSKPDIVVADLSFISLSKIMPALEKHCSKDTLLAMMAKPQFESEGYSLINGVVKNSRDRKAILDRLETWFRSNGWVVITNQDSGVSGAKGNVERFYLLRRAI